MSIEERLTRVEQSMVDLRQDVTSLRGAVVSIDGDVLDLKVKQRAQDQVLAALRETQIEQGRTLEQHGELLTELTTNMTFVVTLLRQIAGGSAPE